MKSEARYTMSCQELDRYSMMKRLERRENTQAEIAKEAGLSLKQIKRLWKRYRAEGVEGIKRRPSIGNRSFSKEFKSKVLSSVRSQYPDFGPTFASEKLEEVQGLKVNHETLRQWMMEDGLWYGRARKTARIHQTRPRRSRRGELIQIDGSHHAWFEDRGPKCCAYVMIDDATSELMGLRFEKSETTMGYFRTIHRYLLKCGRPIGFYSDRDSIFVVGRGDSIDGLKGQTQFQRAMGELRIEMISAYSPQAKGRVERANQTLQDRLIKEMRLRGISTIEAANAYAEEFIKSYNRKFAKPPALAEDAHRPLPCDSIKLTHILSIQETRTLSKNLEFSYRNGLYQIQRIGSGYALRKTKVIVCEKIDGTLDVLRNEEVLKYKYFGKVDKQPNLCDAKEINTFMDERIAELKAENNRHIPFLLQASGGLIAAPQTPC